MSSDEKAEGMPAGGTKRARSSQPGSTGGTSPGHARSHGIHAGDMSLTQMLEALELHDHLCLIYESPEEWRAAVVPFIAIGLQRGQKCVYIIDTSTAAEIRQYLGEEGVDVASAEECGQLSILHETEAYTRDGSFDPDRMIALLISETEKAVAEGYPALRVTGEMTWVLRGRPGSERVLEYEAKLNRDFFPQYPCLAICQYDRWKFDPELIKGVVLTHPILVRGNNVYRNFYYIPTEEFLNAKRADMEVQHWLNNLARQKVEGQKLAESEERLARTNRVLRTVRNINQLITREKDRDRFLDRVCHSLTASHDCRSAWIALLDDSQRLVNAKESGLGKHFPSLVEQLKQGHLPSCARQMLTQPEATAVVIPADRACAGCPLFEHARDYAALCVRLEHAGRVFGVLTCSVSPDIVVDEEEKDLFTEIGHDIALALHDMELDEKHRQAEAALMESEARYHDLYENAPVPYFSVDTTGHIIQANKAVCGMLGYTAAELVGKRILAIHAEECQAQAQVILERFRRGEPIQDEEMVYLTKDGRKVYGLLFGTPIRDDRGRVIGSRSVVKDITDRKQAEEALRQSEERFRLVVNNMRGAVFLADASGRATYVSPSYTRMLGYSLEEARGIAMKDLLVPSSFELAARRMAAIAASGYDEQVEDPTKTWLELEYRCKDGSTLWGELGISFLWDSRGQLAGIVGAIHDITQRKQAEEKLRRSEERLRLMFESVADGIAVTDLQGSSIIEANQRLADMHGFHSIEHMIGKGMPDLLDPCDNEKATISVRKIIEEGADRNVEYTLIRADGSRFPGEISTRLLKDSQGNPVGLISSTRDISERKQLEEERQRVEKLESIGTLAGGIAHDFNNLLTGILGNINLAQRYAEPQSRVADGLLEAERASLRARNLTQQLLTFSRGGAPVRKTASIAELLKESATFALRGSRVRCEFSLPEDLWAVEVDEEQMGQVITNLVINAGEAMPGGGILNIAARNTVVEGKGASPLPKGNYVKITVKDQGIGILKEHLAKIFDPYFTTKQKGSGLGLATAYSIIRNHEGYITVESEVGVGTTFHIHLPATRKPSPAKKKAAKEVPVRGKGRILVMDDEEMIRKMLGKMLLLAGYEVELARDGGEAVEQYRKARESGQPFAAVILDLTIPGGMGGKETIKKLLEIDPDVKAIVSSGYATDPIMADFQKHGFSAVVPKPYGVAELEGTLHRMLRPGKSES